MEIKGPNIPIKPASLGTADLDSPQQIRTSIDSWKTNQLLRASVIDSNPQQTRLNIQGVQVQTKTPQNLALQTNQQLTVQVLSKNAIPDLKIIDIEKPVQQVINQQLRNVLPKQQPITHLLADLKAVATRPEIQRLLPNNLLQSFQKITETIPQANQLKTPEAIKQALQRSGLFTEQQLGQAVTQGQKPPVSTEVNLRTALLRLAVIIKATLANDVKIPLPAAAAPTANLIQHLQQQTPQPQATVASRLMDIANVEQLKLELLKQVEASLARIQTMQLTSVKTDDSTNPLWAMELPIRNQDNTDIFDIRIQQEQHGHDQDDAKHRWSVSIAFDIEGLGAIYVKASLLDDKISATFWLAEPETHELFSEYMQTLHKRLKDAGLDIEQLNLAQGIPDNKANENWQPIVDEKV